MLVDPNEYEKESYESEEVYHSKGETDCTNNGSFVSVPFVLVGCRQDIGVHTCSIPYRLLYEAVFELKEAGFKLDVTRWVPRLTQSV